MILTRATGLINSGLWVAMAIVESCGFHDTPDAALLECAPGAGQFEV
jgi:hypothetical protein